MSDITGRRANTDRQDGKVLSFQMGAENIYEGALVEINSSGFAVNGGDDSGAVFAGVAEEIVDNSGGSAGDLEIKVWTGGGVVTVASAFSAAQTNVGDEVTLSDNQTVDVAGTTTNDVVVGRIVEVISASKVRVALYPFGGKR